MDTEAYYKQLNANTAEFLDVLKSCNEDELRFKSEERWSILEIAEHILVTERIVNIIIYKNTENKSDKSENYGYDN
jgi:hypothetical protein